MSLFQNNVIRRMIIELNNIRWNLVLDVQARSSWTADVF